MSIEDRAKLLRTEVFACARNEMDKDALDSIVSALREERRLALEEAIKACGIAWENAGKYLPHHGDCQTEIRKLMEG